RLCSHFFVDDDEIRNVVMLMLMLMLIVDC
ncbi:MAG: hypothetical protein ACI90V_012599, partial [Bacillariaceae sp.]